MCLDTFCLGINLLEYMKKLNLLALALIISITVMAQNKVLKVWPDGAPTDNGKVVSADNSQKNVWDAEMTVYLPDSKKNTGAAVVICPGGGYTHLAIDHEGHKIAKFLQEKGVAGIVLRYRLPFGHNEVPSSDARQAMRIVRANAKEWGIDPQKVGLAGSSAGGHLASTVGTVFDSGNAKSSDKIAQQSCRPDFLLLLYPVVTMDSTFTHMGSRTNLLGKNPDAALVKKYSNELNVSDNTPPTFLVLADNDGGVPPRNSIEFYMQLKKHKVPAEMHIFAQGGHGFGIRDNGLPCDEWPEMFYTWLEAIKVVK